MNRYGDRKAGGIDLHPIPTSLPAVDLNLNVGHICRMFRLIIQQPIADVQ